MKINNNVILQLVNILNAKDGLLFEYDAKTEEAFLQNHSDLSSEQIVVADNIVNQALNSTQLNAISQAKKLIFAKALVLKIEPCLARAALISDLLKVKEYQQKRCDIADKIIKLAQQFNALKYSNSVTEEVNGLNLERKSELHFKIDQLIHSLNEHNAIVKPKLGELNENLEIEVIQGQNFTSAKGHMIAHLISKNWY